MPYVGWATATGRLLGPKIGNTVALSAFLKCTQKEHTYTIARSRAKNITSKSTLACKTLN